MAGIRSRNGNATAAHKQPGPATYWAHQSGLWQNGYQILWMIIIEVFIYLKAHGHFTFIRSFSRINSTKYDFVNFNTLIFFLNLCWQIPCSVLTLPRDIGGCQIKSLWQWGSQDHSDAVNIPEIDLCFMFRTILSSLDYLRHPFSISVFGGLMYWSEWDTHAIYQVLESICDTT